MDEERGRKEGDILIVRISWRKEVGAAREHVGAGELETWDMGELKVEISEIQEPASLATI